MVEIEFLGPLSRDSIKIEANTLKDVSEYLKKDETIAKWLPKIAVAVNDDVVKDIDTPLKDGDKITLLPPVCGG
jgi:molybdopterin synthase sulfur carrier subunit